MSIIVKHWNIVQLTSHNILGLVSLILVVPISTNCSLIKGIKILIGELKFDYDISSQSSYLILDLDPNACNFFRFGLFHMKICNILGFWKPIVVPPILKNEF
jgi:hypothetical protein